MSKEGLQFFTESPLAILKQGLNKSFRLTAAASLFLTACATSVNAEGDDKPIEPTSIVQMTDTIVPTDILATPEPGPTATETAPLIDEHEIEIAYIETIDELVMGVEIKAELITDGSLDPHVTKITVPDEVYAKFIAETIFNTWWTKGNERHTGPATEEDFRAFMSDWAKAQASGLPEDWEKVQLNDFWANDLNDGNGYVQNASIVWPMFKPVLNGETPEGVKGMESMAFAAIDTDKVKNLTITNEDSRDGYGVNFDGTKLIIYFGTDHWSGSNIRVQVAQGMGIAWQWLRENSESESHGRFSSNFVLRDNLLDGGLAAQ